ncbi:ABC transporter ATP-binding protein [Roseovarius sp. D0-M9]|uniref:ABC transporter ATP-binding protein n=1 Tax=Roseovarius sp. D0-M9 TaxID=3127117 RepID=UPI00300FB44C
MANSQPIISVQQVGKSYGAFRAIENISLEIKHGEFFSLLGASGCGKTTLLRMLAGLEDVTDGEILIDGAPMSGVPPFRRPVNMVFQSYAIFPHLNVADNIGYGLRKQRLPRARRNEMIDEMLSLVMLEGYGERRANQLSGGQRQRIALARALIMRPKVLLLDEPLGALDKQLREQMQLELRRLQQTLGITFVFVTHDQEEALTLSDRIAVMSGGDVLQVDTPSGLYERPRNRQIASFIGNMNFMNARVLSREAGTAAVEIDGLGKIEISAKGTTLSAGDRTCVAIRPEKLRVHTARPEGRAPGVEGTLEMTTYLGERSHHRIRVPGLDQPLSVSSQNSTIEVGAPGTGQRPVWLTWADGALIPLNDA